MNTETNPETPTPTQEKPVVPAPSANGPATCLTCLWAALYSPRRCFGDDCPHRL
jgi:hypothetical protein